MLQLIHILSSVFIQRLRQLKLFWYSAVHRIAVNNRVGVAQKK